MAFRWQSQEALRGTQMALRWQSQEALRGHSDGTQMALERVLACDFPKPKNLRKSP
jgi:hypothetical protein